jgi:purine-nucleoside phosphorylase
MYEGHPAALTALPVRVFARLGIGTVVLTNAAGGIRRGFGSGTVMLIADQINLSFRNALFGPALPGEIRFPDMSDPYDPALRTLAREVARRRKIPLAEGVYVGLLGPSYETPAEVRMLERLGADAVGMSTVPEVILARFLGLRVAAVSTITNMAAGMSAEVLSHEHTKAMAPSGAAKLERVLRRYLAAG